MPANLENSAVSQDWKRSVFIPIPKKGNAKESSNYCTITLISHATKVTLKIPQARLSNTWTMKWNTVWFTHTYTHTHTHTHRKLEKVWLGQWQMSHDEKHRFPEGEHQIKKEWGTCTFLEDVKVETTLKWVNTQALGPDREQLSTSKLGKESDNVLYCHLLMWITCRVYY